MMTRSVSVIRADITIPRLTPWFASHVLRRIGLRRTARAQRAPKLKGPANKQKQQTRDDNERTSRAKCKNVALPVQLRAIFATSCPSDRRYHSVREGL